MLTHRRVSRTALLVAVALAVALPATFSATLAHAGSPLGIGTAEPSFQMDGPLAGVMLWINTHQQAFYRALTEALRGMRDDPHQLWVLIGLSFAYGVFHAAGPGHGKAVISSYMVANELELKRGIAISIASSILQAIVAIVTVGVMFLVLRGSGITLTRATDAMEAASFALVVAFGVWLLVRKLSEIFRHRQPMPVLAFSGGSTGEMPSGGVTAGLFDAPQPVGTKSASSSATGLRFQADAADSDRYLPREGEICVDCGRSHLPSPAMVGAEHFSIKEAWSAIVAVGLRPCSGALLVMTFAMLNQLYLGGILSVFAMAAGTAITVSALAIAAVGAKGLAVRLAGNGSHTAYRVGMAIEIGGALFIILVGSLLLAASLQGYHLSSG
ncbi:delayed-early response protein/equilibrative nucleoside transporter [Agrobacterium vitis]|uniref:Nickel/cobalt efflux system n=1 Tax=Agrobacterium vitis TaxID=373 RepID=A0ABD6G4E1_AGRVI|nr:nickel/cobalt transporter [Agrobacterium vitis]MUO78343.1 delayed-early response protein/equilibrative nucleoside transporter [Agrobacterium vitis]MUO94220.1 delayed-early response protein/equilibrative nucleoside transporter [Agrobacterium vitis]MUP03325.1 delayed-early response protein/equilibrative nucleoside transporter [Agrobacterium vitis]MUZ84440.1 delayed-early response protein/equilibrative nucleoside transporter [Agrobacterium vitis]MVA10336.1 delayed-early response protein/equili